MARVAQAHWWEGPPPRQVSYLAGVAPGPLGVALDPLPEGAPAVVSFRPAPVGSVRGQVDAILRELDRAAVLLYPHWLPGAAAIAGPDLLGVAAVRALAERVAAGSRSFGPFLADLAERGLRHASGETPPDRGRFPPEVRAAGLARAIADAYGRAATVLIIELGPLPAAAERALTHAAEWLVHHGGFTVWLAGAPLHTIDRIRSVWLTLPPYFRGLPAGPDDPPPGPRVAYPPVSGFPRADSPAELALERALAACEWARGRRWNFTYEPDILGRQYRLDLYWPAERLVVEVDGPDHRAAAKYADDRRRDVHLQIRELDVLRFTNEQVLADVPLVLHHIRQLLLQRRKGPSL